MILRQDDRGVSVDGTQPPLMHILSRAFPSDRYSLEFSSFHRGDLAAAVRTGQVHLAVVSISAYGPSGADDASQLTSRDTAGVDTIFLQHAGYAVVAVNRSVEDDVPETTGNQGDDDSNEAAPSASAADALAPASVEVGQGPTLGHGSTRGHAARPAAVALAVLKAFLLSLLIGGPIGLLGLAATAFLLNVRIPNPRQALGTAVTLVDPQLTRIGKVFRWLVSSSSGAFLAIIWGILGTSLGFLFVVTIDTRSKHTASSVLRSQLLDGAQLASYPSLRVYELRDDWVKCLHPLDCLERFSQGASRAIAGDRDLLCSASLGGREPELDFEPGIAVPTHAAFLVPAARSTGAASGASCAATQLREAIREEPRIASPWRTCEPIEPSAEPSPP